MQNYIEPLHLPQMNWTMVSQVQFILLPLNSMILENYYGQNISQQTFTKYCKIHCHEPEHFIYIAKTVSEVKSP